MTFIRDFVRLCINQTLFNRVEITDFQSVCQEKGGVNSGGTSFLLKPLFSLSAYAEWWTTKAVWSLLYFNFYSWFFSETGASTEATDDAPKNISCIRNVTTYYSTTGDILQNGTTTCEDCPRHHVVASVPDSNLYLVVIDAICGPCSDSIKDMGIPGEPREIQRGTVENACKEPGYRKRPQRCFVSTHSETGYMCGTGSFITPSLRAITLQLLCFITVLWRIIGGV
ncbi:voltage-dependent calcium channel subunit alpha-2/delta-3-like isoform X2 [Orbicella faveolata]|uniref:voltage-dependent calcium channel subunit alpha-2/delta-3-like isoform X2 n=1 Tax=Orbicella faveolata TaxID=48498 RepID=UPI0009E1CD4D|nr:voltage-dependent calcium channel subunit alpha-2/delta-3-like isoform X2 [Orbicella faveolata]